MRATKLILFSLVLLLLAISSLQLCYPVFKESPLNGFFSQNPSPSLKYFTWRRWFSSNFQDEITKQFNDHLGLRNSLVRISNQCDYSLYGIIHADGFIRGKNRYLYEEGYIHEYTGEYFIGTAAIDKKLSRLKNVMDSLNAYHIPLLLVYEPGKAGFYPEFIPGRFHPEKRTLTNYEYMLQRSQELGLTFMDLHSYFLKMKDTSRYALFPRYGMHWSMYGAHIAADTISRFLSTVSNVKMPFFQVRKMHLSSRSLGSDYDIGEMLNLACPLEPTPGAYPMVPFHSIPAGILSALVVADSYYITLVESYGKKMFGKQDFWYYNKKMYPNQNNNPPEYVDKSSLREKLKKYDVILLMVSEINLHCGFWNFADEAFLAFHPEIKDPLLYGIENEIRNDRQWFQFISGRALREQMTLEKTIRINAEYVFFSNYNNLPGKGYWDTIQYISMNIKNNTEWIKQITKNAHDQNMPVDSAILLNAIYTYNQSKKKP